MWRICAEMNLPNRAGLLKCLQKKTWPLRQLGHDPCFIFPVIVGKPHHQRRNLMRKAVGLALALTLAFSLTAAAEETRGTIWSTNAADRSIVLEDGTVLWVSEGQFAELAPGDRVQAAYQTTGDKKVVTQLSRFAAAPDGTRDPVDSMQSPD
jgi:hypothetical protein